MMTKPVKIVNNLTDVEWQNGLLADVAKHEKWVGVVTRIILFLLFLLPESEKQRWFLSGDDKEGWRRPGSKQLV